MATSGYHGNDRIPTYVSKMAASFQDVHLQPDGGIPTASFLAASKLVLPLLDNLDSTTYAPMRREISGNIRKIHEKYSTDTEKFSKLQKLVQYEVDEGEFVDQDSVTWRLLWLKRGLEFTNELLAQCLSDPENEENMKSAVETAYTKSLKDYNGIPIQIAVATLVAENVPTREEVKLLLSLQNEDVKNACYVHSLRCDMKDYIKATKDIIRVLCDYYTANDLDFPDRI